MNTRFFSSRYTALQKDTLFQLEEQRKNINKAQETIFRFWLDLVNHDHPEEVLFEFKKLFLYHTSTGNPDVIQALYEIIIADNAEEFKNTIKRSCYILINNWSTSRNHDSIRRLVLEVIPDKIIEDYTSSMTLNRLRGWIKQFIATPDYEELKLFVARYEETVEKHWSQRYTSYLLVHQYTNLKNSPEHREAAKIRAQELKERFKFDLAMYTARFQSSSYTTKESAKNPTGLGDEVLQLIRSIITKRGQFTYSNLANIFLQQTEGLCYEDFKKSLQKYLIYSVDNRECVEALNIKLSKKLKHLYQEHHDEILTDALMLRTCKRVVEFLTTESHQRPSSLFILLLSQGHPLTLVIILLKITLICKPVRPHLEACLAELIQHYMNYPENECKWVVNFLEILKITFVIYDDNVRYNVVNMKTTTITNNNPPVDNYRIFSQLTWNSEEEEEENSNIPENDSELSQEIVEIGEEDSDILEDLESWEQSQKELDTFEHNLDEPQLILEEMINK